MARILVIDDDETFSYVLKRACSRQGHEVMLSASACEAKEASAGMFDIVFLDISLPDGNGPHVGQLSLYPMGQLWRCVPSSAPVKSHRSVPHLPQSALQRLAAAHCFYLQLGRFSSLLRLFLCT